MEWKIALIGFGHVGRSLAQLFLDKEEELRRVWGSAYRLTAICTGQNGNFHAPDGLPVLQMLNSPRSSAIWESHHTSLSCEELIDARVADIFCELSPTEIIHSEPSLSRSRRILGRSLHLVTANKGPSVLAGDELAEIARTRGCGFFQEATVMSGSPVFSLIEEAMPHCRFLSFRGAVNGSSNYILSEMENGATFTQALESAQNLGYTEADFSLDIDGWDSTAKAVILATHLFKHKMNVKDVLRQGIRDFPQTQIRQARADSLSFRLVSQGFMENKRLHLEVSPQAIPPNDPLCMACGSKSVLTLNTDILGEVTLTGPGAGGRETAAAVLSDLLRIHRTYAGKKRSACAR